MWTADLGNGKYKNPVLYADYSDPDVIRVGDDFFMTASSFMYAPGLPILHSKDLVNWQVVSYALEQMPYETYTVPAHGKGVWAPAIRYHEGTYYIYFGAPDEGIIMVKTTNPFGKWEEPVLVAAAKGWIDPCPLWDEDGNAYLIHAFAASRCGIKSILHLHRMKPDGTALLDEGTLVIDGRKENPTIEGPKLYKRNGYYYIFAPAGGVECGWQCVFRATNIYGPYEEKVVLTQGATRVNGPHQGGLVELESGESWFMHFQDLEAYGRVVHLQPVTWQDGWPVIGEPVVGQLEETAGTYRLCSKDGSVRVVDRTYLGQPVLTYAKPNVGGSYPVVVPATSDDFSAPQLGLQWQWQAIPKRSWYNLLREPSRLRLYHQNEVGAATLYQLPNVLTQMIQMPIGKATADMHFVPSEDGEECGLVVTGKTYHAIALVKTAQGNKLVWKKGYEENQIRIEEECVSKFVDVQELSLQVRIHNTFSGIEEAVCQFYYRIKEEGFMPIGEPFLATPGGWVGAKLGIYATNFGQSHRLGYTDVKAFCVEE